MRYALISDIHANLPALDAVLADVARRDDVDAVFHLGDLVGYGPWPNEVVHRLRDARIPGIAGNYDSTVASDYKHCGCRYEDPRQETLSHLSYAWTRAHVSAETKAFLGRLPFRLDLRALGGHVAGPTLTLVHGTSLNNVTYWTEDRPDSFCTKMADVAGAHAGDIIAFGHTHKPWHRTVGGVHLVNTGSVGRPKDGDWRAGFAVVSVDAPGEIAVDYVRVEYDVDQAMDAIRRSDLPDEFAEYLRYGGQVPTIV
ncbi:MAG TPA: metallophosphoesterase family protein [Vicinamibacterales bacterium]|nr:metallophosphoesterase family protein [Vicinamibacterales bacterium]